MGERSIRRRILVAIGFLVVFGTYFALARYYLVRGEMNADEGFYAIAARSVMEGKIPYRDFAYTQMPLLPYLNGLGMTIFGFGLDAQRCIDIAWGALGLVAIVLSLRQRYGHWEPGLIAAFAVAASPHFVAFQAMGKTYAASGCFLACAFGAVLLRGTVIPRALAFALFATAAVGSRSVVILPLVPAAAALLLQSPGSRERVVVLGMVLGVGAVALLPFFALAPSAFLFLNVKYHLGSGLIRPWRGRALEWWVTAPLSILLSVAGLAQSDWLIRRRLWTELLLLVGAVLGIVLPIVPEQAYGEYALPSMLVAGAAGMAALWSSEEGPPSSFRHFVWVVPLVGLFHPRPSVTAGAERTDERVLGAARFVREHAPPGLILAAIPIVAVEAGREVVPGTEMGQFSVLAPQDAARASTVHLTTLDDLTSSVRSRAPAAIVMLAGQSNWNFRWQVPSLSFQPQALYDRFERQIRASYARAYSIANIEVWLRRQ
jgi:hypothetical protein